MKRASIFVQPITSSSRLAMVDPAIRIKSSEKYDMLPRLRVFSLSLLLAAGLPAGWRSAQAQPAVAPRPLAADEKALTVYPNPSTGIVHIAINGFEGRKLELRVLNVIGTVMYRETLTELNDRYTRTLDLSRFTNGLYYVKLESDNTSEMRKLVIR